ncbi:MAG: hypothetical protein Q7S34_03895 [bacterium]|nr:hypothetical protein [bacterium]
MKTLIAGLFFFICISAQAMTTTVVRQDAYAFRDSGKLAIGEDRATIVLTHDKISHKKQRNLHENLRKLLAGTCEDTPCDLRSSPSIKGDIRAVAEDLGIRVTSIKILYKKLSSMILKKSELSHTVHKAPPRRGFFLFHQKYLF